MKNSNKQRPSLVFVMDLFSTKVKEINFFIQRGDPAKRVGPFVNKKVARELINHLPEKDQLLISYLQKNRFILEQKIDKSFMTLDDVANIIASHQNLFIRKKRFGSISRASASDRELLIWHGEITPESSCGRLLGGDLEIMDNGLIRAVWKYESISAPVPIMPLINGANTLRTDDNRLIQRDTRTETKWLEELCSNLKLSPSNIMSESIDNANLISLLHSPKSHWTVVYKGTPTHIAKAQFSTSGISWFEGDENSQHTINYESIIEAYLAGRRHIEIEGKLFLLPSISDKNVNNDIALRLATGGIKNIPYSNIINVGKIFNYFEKNTLQQKLKDYHFGTVLREYQLEGVLWLCDLHNYKLGGILADEMGLGKTIQTLAYIVCKNIKKTLIVTPASVAPNWKAEILKLAPGINANEDILIDRENTKQQIDIISYQRAQKNIKHLQEIPYDLVVLDEGQFVKNPETKTAFALKKVKSNFRIVITGTPIENSVKDLWAHLVFTNTFLEKPYRHLLRKFSDFGKSKIAADISIKAFGNLIMRRTKADVESDLPPILERIVYCEMSGSQKDIYLKTLNAFKLMLKRGVAGRINSIALEALLRLRQCCSLPQMLPKALNYHNLTGSVKIDTAIRIILDDIFSNRKTILFSQFRMVLDTIESELKNLNILFTRLDGNSIDRAVPVNIFQNDYNVRVFLIGFRAGGFGLNLTMAESVILFDPWWNPAAEQQAFARAHRIGQNKTVFVSKLICRNSIEEKMLDLVSSKKDLAESVSNMSSPIPMDELIRLINT